MKQERNKSATRNMALFEEIVVDSLRSIKQLLVPI